MKTALLISTLLLTFTSFAHAAGNDGGGGGGICVNGKCMTLAEAGLTLATPPSLGALPSLPVLPQPAISTALNNEYLKDQALLRGSFSAFADFKDGTNTSYFTRVTIVDDVALGKIKSAYIDLLEQANFPTENFELFAVSNAQETYLLPTFYKLSVQSQALVLFHEEMMRRYFSIERDGLSYSQALSLILSFDNGVLKLLKGDLSGVYLTQPAIARLTSSGRNNSDFTTSVGAFFAIRGHGRILEISNALSDGLAKGERVPHPTDKITAESYDFWTRFENEQPELLKYLESWGMTGLALDENAEFSEELSHKVKSFCTLHTGKTILADSDQQTGFVLIDCRPGAVRLRGIEVWK